MSAQALLAASPGFGCSPRSALVCWRSGTASIAATAQALRWNSGHLADRGCGSRCGMSEGMDDMSHERRASVGHANSAPAAPTRALVLATISFAVSFAAWGLVGGLASVFVGLYDLTASQTALLVAVPVLLGSLARLPMGIVTDRFGGRLVFTALLAFSSLAAFV